MTSNTVPTATEHIPDQQTQTIEQLQNELHKSNLQINKLESTIQKLQSQLSSLTASSNNTSSSFLLTSEFKELWNSLGKENIMEGFENVFNISVLLSHMVQETFLLTYQEASLIIDNKIIEIKKVFNLNDTTCSKERFYNKIKPLFIEFFSPMFNNENEYTLNVENIITKLGMSIYKRQIAKYFNREISLDLDSDNLKLFIQKSLKLCFYMHLHNPKLDININPFEKRELQYNYYNKFNYVSIEGFENENSPCLVILPPPMLNISKGYSFQGLKPFVYIIADPDEKIMEICESQRLKNGNKLKHSKSYGGSEYTMNQERKEDKEQQTIIVDKCNEVNVNEHNKDNNNISKIENDYNKKSRNKSMITSSSTSVLKKTNMCMMDINDFYIEQLHKPNHIKNINLTSIAGLFNNNNISNTLNIISNSNTINNPNSRNYFLKKHAISRNIPSSNLNPSRTQYKSKQFEFSSEFQPNLNFNSNTLNQMNSIEKEINFDFICHKTSDAVVSQRKFIHKPYNNNTSITHKEQNNTTNSKQQSSSPVLLFNSDKHKKMKTKQKIKNNKPKCFNVKPHTTNSISDYTNNSSNNSLSSIKKAHKKIIDNISITNNNNNATINVNACHNCSSNNISGCNKKIKKNLPLCFSNDMLRYGNSFTKSNNSSINVVNGNDITNKRKDNVSVVINNEITNTNNIGIMNYNYKKQITSFPSKKNKHVI
jgi:hypothetical protein